MHRPKCKKAEASATRVSETNQDYQIGALSYASDGLWRVGEVDGE
jgi:hypothetical protein